MVRTLGCPGRVTQRLKRMATILDKLERESSLALDKMQDIGGCRAVLTCVDDVWRLRDRIVKVHPEARVLRLCHLSKGVGLPRGPPDRRVWARRAAANRDSTPYRGHAPLGDDG